MQDDKDKPVCGTIISCAAKNSEPASLECKLRNIEDDMPDYVVHCRAQRDCQVKRYYHGEWYCLGAKDV